MADPVIELFPVTPVIGAVVTNLTLSANPDQETLDIIGEALSEHQVLIFKDQQLSASALRTLTEKFGPLFHHHADDGVIHNSEAPEVLEMIKEADGNRLFGGSDWHSDVTFRRPEGLVSILHAREIPPCGGDTVFASNIAAYNALSIGMKELLGNLQAVHSYNGRGRPEHPIETAVHPVVRQHPDTGQFGLYINRMFAIRFVGMSCAESEPLIDFLDHHMTRPEFTCRVSWQVGQVVMWDNRFSLHYPIDDFSGYRRRLLRCTAMCR